MSAKIAPRCKLTGLWFQESLSRSTLLLCACFPQSVQQHGGSSRAVEVGVRSEVAGEQCGRGYNIPGLHIQVDGEQLGFHTKRQPTPSQR